MEDLFSASTRTLAPLADRMRPKTLDDFIAQTGDINGLEAHEIVEIYMAYEDDDPELYELLPLEARLFDE